MRNLVRCTLALLLAAFALAHGASAASEEDESEESEYVRTGFYIGVGGTSAFPNGWSDDFDGGWNGEATDLANDNAQEALDELPPANDEIIPLELKVNGSDLDDVQAGVNAVIGYRTGPLVAFEIEGEWLLSSSETFLDVTDSIGSHSAEVSEIWMFTANTKIYPPLTGRFQPFGKFGVGLQHSRLETDIETVGITTTNENETIVVPADFRIHSNKTKLDGAIRMGGGIDIYVTPNIVAEANVTYAVPFADIGPVNLDYVAIQYRFVYRF